MSFGTPSAKKQKNSVGKQNKTKVYRSYAVVFAFGKIKGGTAIDIGILETIKILYIAVFKRLKTKPLSTRKRTIFVQRWNCYKNEEKKRECFGLYRFALSFCL